MMHSYHKNKFKELMQAQTHSIQISDPNIEVFSLQHDHKSQDAQTTHMSIDNEDKENVLWTWNGTWPHVFPSKEMGLQSKLLRRLSVGRFFCPAYHLPNNHMEAYYYFGQYLRLVSISSKLTRFYSFTCLLRDSWLLLLLPSRLFPLYLVATAPSSSQHPIFPKNPANLLAI